MASKNAHQLFDYVLIQKSQSQDGKKIKKKLTKKKLWNIFQNEIYNNIEDDIVGIIKSNLIKMKSKYSKVKTCPDISLGFILDTNVLLHDITYLPPVPEHFDILCLESDIKKYVDKDTVPNIYWTQVNICNTGNFVINLKSIDIILDTIKRLNITKWKEFIEMINNNLKVFTITQYQLSETKNLYVHDPDVKMKIKDTNRIELEKQFYKKLSSIKLEPSDGFHESTQVSLPKVSLITCFVSKELLFHSILTFLKMSYPRELLELIIIDDTDSEKKMNLPEDKRIKLINLNSKDNYIPLGYKLNSSIKYATGDVIFHFFGTHVYNPETLQDNILHFVSSGKDCMLSNTTGVYNDAKKSIEYKIPDLANMIYYKTFWKTCSFDENSLTTEMQLLYKYIKFRSKCIIRFPFVLMSFNISKTTDKYMNHINVSKRDLPFKLEHTISANVKESFDILNNI